jgi:hypothetical protein
VTSVTKGAKKEVTLLSPWMKVKGMRMVPEAVNPQRYNPNQGVSDFDFQPSRTKVRNNFKNVNAFRKVGNFNRCLVYSLGLLNNP